ncbi:MAG: hypothetical protein HY360_25185 [Verrucomicrobia bacterium]|nr:hypothetical protein [Verrucomicrobiota bacterium]
MKNSKTQFPEAPGTRSTSSIAPKIFLFGRLVGIGLLAGVMVSAQTPPAKKKLKNIALDKPYTVDPPANYPLCTDDNDDVQLTDGDYTKGHFWATKSTVGWQEKQRLSNEYAWTVLCPPEELAQYQRLIDEAKAVVPPDSMYRKRIEFIEKALLKALMLEPSAKVRERMDESR